MRRSRYFFTCFIALCLLSFGLGSPTAALAEVDLFSNKTQFLAHHYSSPSEATDNGSTMYWRWVDYDSVDNGGGMTNVMGQGTSNYQERYFMGGIVESEIKDGLVLHTKNYVYDGQDLDLSIQAKFPAGMKVYLVGFGYIMAGKVENVSHNTGSNKLPYYVNEIHFNSRWYKGTDSMQVLGHNLDGWDVLQVDDDGGIFFPETYTQFTIRWTMKRSGGGTDKCDYFAIDRPMLIWNSDSAEMQGYVDEIMDTTGSDSVADGPMEYVSTVTGKLGFVQQAGQTVTGLYQAIGTTDAVGTIRFPGVSWEGQTIIAAQDVPLVGYLPSNVEDRIRDGTTLVFIVAWLSGLKRIYDRIFNGESDVIVDEE